MAEGGRAFRTTGSSLSIRHGTAAAAAPFEGDGGTAAAVGEVPSMGVEGGVRGLTGVKMGETFLSTPGEAEELWTAKGYPRSSLFLCLGSFAAFARL